MAVTLWCALPQAAIADENSKANRLVVEAVQLLKAADEEQNLPKKVELLTTAKQNLERIIEDYPGSDAAVKLATGQNIGVLSLNTVSAQLGGARAPVLLDIALKQLGAQNLDAARMTLSTAIEGIRYIRDTNVREGLFVDAIIMQAYAVDFDGATENVQFINDTYKRAQALRGIAEAQIYAEVFDSALVTLDTAIETTQYISDALGRVLALINIAEMQEQAGNLDGALNTFGTAIDTAQNASNIQRAMSLEKLRSSALVKYFPNL